VNQEVKRAVDVIKVDTRLDRDPSAIGPEVRQSRGMEDSSRVLGDDRGLDVAGRP
jgi:hypothetical protein